MADKYLTLDTTPAGMNMIIRSLYGDKITFTRIVLGNGRPKDIGNVTALANPLLEISITNAEKKSDYLLLTGYTSSSNINASFYGYELGVYAKDADENEYLYAYRYNSADVDYYPAAESGRSIELTLSIVVQLGNAENVTAILIEGDVYTTKTDFDDHVKNTDNPHKVTKEQVGLGNAENKSTNDQTPTYTISSELSKLVSGEKLSIAFGKIAKAISDLIKHIKDKDNPHELTADKIGAAAQKHEHSAADINAGTLTVLRGGTGADSAAKARENLGLKNGATLKFEFDTSTNTLKISE